MHKLVPNGAIHLNSHAKQNGKAKQVELVLVLVLSNVILRVQFNSERRV